MATDNKNSAFTPVRTVRLISAFIAVFGMFMFGVERVLTMAYAVANDAVQTSAGVSNTFMVRFATENISAVQKLFNILKQTAEVLPIADKCLLALFILSVIFIVVAAFGLVFPMQFGHVLVALKLLKWQNKTYALSDGTAAGDSENAAENASESESSNSVNVSEKLKEFGGKVAATAKKCFDVLKKVQVKYWIFIGCALAFVLVLVFGVRGCSNVGIFGNTQSVTDDLTQQTLFYINAQKSFFAKNKAVGGPKSLQLPDSLTTDYFTYRVSGGRFAATLNKKVKECPAGSKWSVSAGTKGFFTVDLVLYRQAPKDSNCTFIAPDFKNIGRK